MTDAAVPQPKKPGFIRWWGLIVFLILGVLGAAVLPFLVERWTLNKLRNGLAANGWELTPESKLSFSLYGGRLSGEALVMRMIQKSADGSQAQVATADRLNAELAVLDSLSAGDVIVRELAIEGMTGNLRRGPDGRITTIPPDPEEKPGAGIDWGKVDWVGWYEKGMDRYKKWSEEQKAQKEAEEQAKKDPSKPVEKAPESARPAPETDIDWPKAVRYQPLPKADRHIPRVVVRKLSITGKAIKLPDESPFEVASFDLKGTDVSLRQDHGETMKLTGLVTTTGAGNINLDLQRNPDDTGHLKLAAPAVPVAALSHPAIAGDALAKYGATGTANLTIDQAWKNWDLTGSVLAQVSGLAMQPAAADADTLRIATAVNALKGKQIAWPVTMGGTLFAPKVTDSGVEAVLKGSAVDAAKGIIKDKATEKASELLNQQGEKNPEVKKATDALQGLFGK